MKRCGILFLLIASMFLSLESIGQEIQTKSDKKQYNTDLVTALEVINMVEICILIVKSAIIRRESRGAHFRSDFPDTKDEWKKSIIMSKNKIEFEAR